MELKPNHSLCPNCKGTGRTLIIIPNRNSLGNQDLQEYDLICFTCYGAGQLDWIEVIVGKRFPIFNVITDFDELYNKITSPLRKKENE